MPKKRKRKEIVVSPPALRPKEEPLLRDTTGVEALDVSKASMKIGKYLPGIMIGIGAFLSLFSIFGILIPVEFSFSNPFIGALGVLGAVNIFCGLVLLAKE
jgi:hypothetical protein